MSVLSTPGFDLQPSAERKTLASNYITNFDFLNQYLPDTYEKEFERYGNRSVASFLRSVGAEMPSISDLIKWAEQGRLHTKYVNCASDAAAASDTATITVNDTLVPGNGGIAFRIGQTVFLSDNNEASKSNKAIITDVDYTAGTFDVAYYEAGGQTFGTSDVITAFVYGSEFRKGTEGMVESLEADDLILENSPIIIKDKYAVSGSDMAQIGWVEVTSENGATGYLWYIKSEHETRLRFEDYLELAMIEAVPAESGSGAANQSAVGNKGSEGLFYSVSQRGNVWGGGNPTTLSDFDTIIQRLDKQGAIQENVLFVNATRGGVVGGAINGVLVPAGSTTVYDQVLGKNAKRPFLHVRYRASETEDRRYKTWITGSAGGASNSSLDAMEVHFLSERALCTLGANNFFLFEANS